MRDLVGFVLRGAWAGAAFVLAPTILIYGSMGAFFFLDPLFLLQSLPPGAVVGLVLWFAAGKATGPLTPGKRFAIGTGIAAAIIFPMNFYQAATGISWRRAYDFDIPSMLMRIVLYAAGIGGLAGLACPASREQVNQASQLTYRERVRLYETAEREAKEAHERMASADDNRNQS